MRFFPLAAAASTLLAALLLLARPAQSCSRVLWNDGGRGPLVGRTMDWFEPMSTSLWVLPRGMQREGLTAANPLRWTSRYGSLAVAVYDAATADGVNEAGLGVHMLYLKETKAGPRDPKVPGLSMSLWGQYYLDRFATVAEAVSSLEAEPYQLAMAVEPRSGMPATVHLAIEDRSGDSAILECLDGAIRVHHDRRASVMTNEPRFDAQLANLRRYAGFGGDAPLPGSSEPDDRFVRGAYYVARLPKPRSDREAVSDLLGVMRNVSVPAGEAHPGQPHLSPTRWRTVTDLERGVFTFDNVGSPTLFRVELARLDFAPDQPPRKLAVDDRDDLAGDVGSAFAPATMFPFLKPTAGD